MSEPRAMRTELAPDARTMARGAAVNVVGALTTTALSFALSLLITHEIRASPFGLYSLALVMVLLAQVLATLGVDVGAVRFVALSASRGDEEGARGALQGAFAVVASFSWALALLMYRSAPWLTESFFQKPGAAHLVRLIALSLPALALTRVAIGALQGLGMMRYAALLSPVRVALNIAVAAPVLLLGYGADGLALAFVTTSWATLFVSATLLTRALPGAFRPTLRHWRLGALMTFSVPQTLTTLLLQTILWTDTVLVGRLRPAAEVAVYWIVQRLLSPAQTVSTATGQMFAPRIATEHARGDVATLGMMLKRVTYWNVSMAIPVFGLLLLVPGPLLALFGATYTAGATALAILAAGQIFNAATGPLGQMINMSGRPYVTLANNCAVAALNIVGCLVLIPRYGITGAACSTTGAITLVNLIKLAQVRMLFGINPFRPETLRALGAGAVAVLVALPLVVLIAWPSALVEVLAAALVLVPVYGVLYWLTAAGDEEKELLRLRGRLLVAPATEPPPVSPVGS